MNLQEDPRIRPEMQLLFCCARTRTEEVCAGKIRKLLSARLDWPYLLAAAEEHGVTPLLYCQLKSGFADEVLSAWMRQLQEKFQENVRRNLCLAAELVLLLDRFRGEGILAIPYKGPVLAEQAYGNLAFRQFVDLDIVVPHREIARVHVQMAARGYTPQFPLPSGPDAVRRAPGQYLFRRGGNGLMVEIHTERTLRYFPRPLDLEALAGRLEAVSLGGREVRTFAAEDALPILCVHGSKHFWDRLSWVADIAELAQLPRGINWEASFQQAQRLGVEHMLALGLFLAHDLLGAELGQKIIQHVCADRSVQMLAAEVRRQFLGEGRAQTGAWQRFLFRVRMRGNLVDGIRYSLRLATLPTEDDWPSVQLLGPLSPFYAALRPFRLLRKYGVVRSKTAQPVRTVRPQSQSRGS